MQCIEVVQANRTCKNREHNCCLAPGTLGQEQLLSCDSFKGYRLKEQHSSVFRVAPAHSCFTANRKPTGKSEHEDVVRGVEERKREGGTEKEGQGKGEQRRERGGENNADTLHKPSGTDLDC